MCDLRDKFIMALAERVYAQSELLSRRAERKTGSNMVKGYESPPRVLMNHNPEKTIPIEQPRTDSLLAVHNREQRISSDEPVTLQAKKLTVKFGGGIIEGVGRDAPIVTNENGAKQSASTYRCDLLPPRAVLAVAGVLREGSEKYGDDNWRGIPIRDHLNHAMTHVLAHLAGDSQDDHLEHAACRLLMALDLKRIEGERHDEDDW